MSPSASIVARKRSLASFKPNPTSSSDSSIQYHKKPKNSSNLPDCHCCGSQITHNSQTQLQTLESYWRIVPLCVNCVSLVNSGEFCSYCLSKIGDDSLRCRCCERRIHSDCVVRYNGFAPWSYSCSVLGFSVCVDCWVPKSIRVPKLGKFGVLNDGFKALEDAVVAADCAVEKKVAVAAKAREKALRKAVAAKRAVELANNALDFVAKSNKTGVMEMDIDNVVVDDAQLAFELHRAMNSSPRIRRPKNCNGGSLVRDSDAESRGFCKKIEVYSYNKINLNNMESVVRDVAVGVARKCSVSKGEELINSSGGDDNSMVTESQSCRNQYDDRFKQIDRYLIKYCKRPISLKEISECETNLCYKGFRLESRGSGSELTLNCFKESRALFDSSLRPLQASGCTSGPSRDQS